MPELVLEQIVLGEIDGATWGVGGDEDERVAALRADSIATLELLPRAAVVARVEAQLAQAVSATAGPRKPRALLWGGPGLLAAAAVLVLVTQDGGRDVPGSRDDGSDDVTIVKGLVPALLIYAVDDRGTTAPLAGPLRAGDRLQLVTVSAGRTHGVVVSVDGRGSATLHFPAAATESTALKEAGARPLPHSFELDDAPGFERFVFVTSAAPIDAARVLAAARAIAGVEAQARSAPLPDLPGLEQWSRVVDKVSP